MFYIKTPSTDPHYNMAFESWCLRNLPQGEPYFYIWRNAPSVIIGENQNAYAEVNLEFLRARGIVLARRTTGGGAVYHDLNNLNYSFIGEDVGIAPIVDALRSMRVDAEVSGRNDIFVDGRKVSGYARRMENGRQLVHGTLLYDVDLDTLGEALSTPSGKMHSKGVTSVRSHVANLKDYLPDCAGVLDFRDRLLEILCAGAREYVLSDEDLNGIRQLRDTKFATFEWNYGRSSDTQFVYSRKFACGTVGLDLGLSRGYIRRIRFGGDFLGNLSTSSLEKRLTGVAYEPESIASALEGVNVGDYFDGMSSDQLASFIISPTLG